MSEAVAAPEKPAIPAIKAILGQKVGMTQIFDEQGRSIPVTVVEAGPCPIVQLMSLERHGYEAIQVGFGDIREKSVNKPTAGRFKKAGVAPGRWTREFRVSGSAHFQVGQALRVDTFTP